MAKYDPYEKDLKDYVLSNPQVLEEDLGDLGDTSVVFEKRLTYSRQKEAKRTVADALIFTENKGIIGVEMKTSTKKDSTVRLKRQLKGYSLNANYVYVFCHDSQIRNVERILKTEPNYFKHVGIVAYDTFKNDIIVGIYRSASQNPHFSTYHALNILHKQEIVDILSTFDKPGKVIARETGLTMSETNSRPPISFGMKMTKPQLINNLISKVGDFEAIKIMCNVFTHNRVDKTRAITLRHFNRKEE